MGPSEAAPANLAHRAAHEARAIQELATGLEDRLLEVVPLSAVRDPQLHDALQAIDRVRQAAEGLATFLGRFGDALPQGAALDARPLAAGLALEDQRARLCDETADETAAAGELDLF